MASELLPGTPAAAEGWLSGGDLLSVETERRLIRAVQVGDASERERAVVVLLDKFRPLLGSQVAAFRDWGVDESDLAQIARLAMLRAVERFDLRRSTRLSSYARPWVEGALRREVQVRGALIRLPLRQSAARARVFACEQRLLAQGSDATVAEVAAAASLSESEVQELMTRPHATASLQQLDEGTPGARGARTRGGWQREAVVFSDVEEDIVEDGYGEREIRALIESYQELRSLSEVQPSVLGEPRLRRRSGLSNLVRLVDLDRALSRVAGNQFVAIELTGLRDLPMRELERLVGVRHSTLADRAAAGRVWLVGWLNGGHENVSVRRLVFWRRLFAWNLGELWLTGEEPVAFEVWARVAGAGVLFTGHRSIPIRALSVFGEGWLLTRELTGRDPDRPET